MDFGTTDLDGMLSSYSGYLHQSHPKNAKRFDDTRTSDREAALAEAVIFGMLQGFHVAPEINDLVETGGADFICRASRGPLVKPLPQDRFIVEATSLDPDAVSRRSHLPNEVPDRIRGGAYGAVLKNIFDKAKKKARQLGGYRMPRVLAIASSHEAIPALFDRMMATWVLVSHPHWRQVIGSDKVDTGEYTDLRGSVFMKPGHNGTIVACRKSISAILLVAMHRDSSDVWGILHPKPARPLNVAFLPDLPFVRIAQWPIVDGKIFTEWVIANPRGHIVHHFPVRLPKAVKQSSS
jgi:hypothetical protein